MNLRTRLHEDARATLLDVLERHRVGMLGLVGSDRHMQPMTHFVDRNRVTLWFITSSETDLARDVESAGGATGSRAHHCMMTPDGEFHACLAGRLDLVDDPAKLDELWSPVTAAWFEEGRSDPHIRLLRLSLDEAAVWTSTASALHFGIEIARANLQREHRPDVGEHMILRLDGVV
jgi:general stress protein 26